MDLKLKFDFFSPVVYDCHMSEVIHHVDRHQAAAIRLARELSADVNTEAARAMFEAEEPLSYRDMARELLPDASTLHPDIAGHAVRMALHDSIPQEERTRVVRRRLGAFRKRTNSRMNPEEFAHHQSEAAKASLRKSPRDARGIVEGRGMKRWGEVEKDEARILGTHPDYLYQSGGKNKLGKPNTAKIAEHVNRVFGNRRTPMAVRELLRKK